MALINDIYIHVTDESLSRNGETSSHPVESGIDITDTVKENAAELSISGLIVDYPTGRKITDKWSWNEADRYEVIKASTVISRLLQLKKTGGLIKYIGRNICDKMQITSFETSHPNTISGGAEFSMTLQECRFAQNSYVAPKIDESSVKNGGQQQVEKGDSEEVWYTTKNGDTVWGLVTGDYKNLKREGAKAGTQGACDWVMEKNPKAFSRKGDFRTLQNGVKILLGVKQ